MSMNVSPISPEDIMKAAKFNDKPKFVFWNGLRIQIRPYIGLSEIEDILRSINECCSGQGDYLYDYPIVDYVLKANIIMRFSNIILPEDMESQHRLIYSTELVDLILQNICPEIKELVTNLIK